MREILAVFVIYTFAWNLCAAPFGVPKPQSLELQGGVMALTAESELLYTAAELKPAADLLAAEIQKAFGLSLGVRAGHTAGQGDILLSLTGVSNDQDDYRLSVNSSALIEGDTYSDIVYGTATLLQSIEGAAIPKMQITDSADKAYRGLMVDVAREWHSIETLKQIIEMCRVYKVKYLQLHLTDDQSFTFPSTAYPQLQGPNNRFYTLAQLNDLVEYARQRGIAIIPEMDIPGHARRLCSAMPELFGRLSTSTLDFGNPAVWAATKTIINEMCDVFTTAPYFHLGGDEVSLTSNFVTDPTNLNTIAEYDLGNMTGLFNHFFNVLNAEVNARGKKTVLWEGFNSAHVKANGVMAKNITVMLFDNYQNAQTFYMDKGYEVINASWFPLYILANSNPPIQSVYEWNIYLFGNYTDPFPRRYTSVRQYTVAPTAMIPGGQVCSWEQGEGTEIETIRQRLAAAMDRLWNHGGAEVFEDFLKRLGKTDTLLQKLLAKSAPSAVTPTASKDLFPDKIRVLWLACEGYPLGYTLKRSESLDFSNSITLLERSQDLAYTDSDVVPGKSYYYRAYSDNRIGVSEVGGTAEGRCGGNAPVVNVYEGFEYAAGAAIGGQSGGGGWDGAWSMNDLSLSFTIKPNGLKYPGLKTAGGCLNMKPTGLTSPERGVITRSIAGSVGHDGSEFWMSFLFHPVKIGDADFSFGLQTGGGALIRKRWGNGLYVTGGPYVPEPFKEGRTHFVVARYQCLNGRDVVDLWMNPAAVMTPPDEKSPMCVRATAVDCGIGSLIAFAMQRYGMEADLDEIRFGSDWSTVCPLQEEEALANPYDGFNYKLGDNSIVLNSGNSWYAKWLEGTAATQSDAVTFTTGLTYKDKSGNSLPTSDGAMRIAPVKMGEPAYQYLSRVLPRSYGDSEEEIYFAFLVKREQENSSLDYSLMLGDNGLSLMVRGWKQLWSVGGQDTPFPKPAEGETQFIVLKISFAAGQDTVSMWMNPSLTNLGAAQFTHAVPHFIMDRITIAQQTPLGFAAQVTVFDEIRIGNSYNQIISMPRRKMNTGAIR